MSLGSIPRSNDPNFAFPFLYSLINDLLKLKRKVAVGLICNTNAYLQILTKKRLYLEARINMKEHRLMCKIICYGLH